ncbi:MAG: hypothetical protein ACREEM_23330 [Blastocatellia bacterium]
MSANVLPFTQVQYPQEPVIVSNGNHRAAVAAVRTDRRAEEIERLPFDLSALEEEGVFINVDATGFGILDRRLDWQALDQYDQIRDEVIATFGQVAADSAHRLEATGAIVPEDFHDLVIGSVLNAFPTEDELRQKLQLRFQVGVILLGSEMLREQRLAAEERRRFEQVEAESRMERMRVNAAEHSIQQQMWAEQESARLRIVADKEDQQREAEVKERLRQMKLDAAREKLQETLSPLQEGAAQLRAQIYESAMAMQEALQKHDFLPGATAKKARNLAHWFRLMNFQTDAELEQLLGDLEKLSTRPEGKNKRRTSNAAVKAVLDDIVQLCYRDAREIGQPNRLAALEF